MSTWFDAQYHFFAKQAQLRTAGEFAGGSEHTLTAVKKIIADTGMTPENHYVMYGRSEGLNLNAYHNEVEYLVAKTLQINGIKQIKGATGDGASWSVDDVRGAILEAGRMTLIDHYEKYGAFETDSQGHLTAPSYSFDADAYVFATLAELVRIGYVFPNDNSVIEMIIGDLFNIFQKANPTPATRYTMYGVQEANEAGIAFAQPASQWLNNDTFRDSLGKMVPTNYEAANDAAWDAFAHKTIAVLNSPDVSGLAPIRISQMEPPTPPVPTPPEPNSHSYTDFTAVAAKDHLNGLDPTVSQTFTVGGKVSASLVGNADTIDASSNVSSTAGDTFTINNITTNGSIIGDVTTINISTGNLTLGSDTISVTTFEIGGILGDSDSIAIQGGSSNPKIACGNDSIKVGTMGAGGSASENTSIRGDARQISFNGSGEVTCGEDEITITSLLKGRIYGDAETVGEIHNITFGNDTIDIANANASQGFTIYGDADKVSGDGTVVFGNDSITLESITAGNSSYNVEIYGDASIVLTNATISGGDDTITVNSITNPHLSIFGGYGNDKINLRVASTTNTGVELYGGLPGFTGNDEKDEYTFTVDSSSGSGGGKPTFIINDFDSQDTVTLIGVTAANNVNLGFTTSRDLDITYDNVAIKLLWVDDPTGGLDSEEVFKKLVDDGRFVVEPYPANG